MRDIVKKRFFFSPYYRKQFAEWLMEQAEKGLFLEDIDKEKCCFRKGEPKKQYYHIARIQEDVSYSVKEKFKELGWDYVCSYKKVHIFKGKYSNVIPSYMDKQDDGELYIDLIKENVRNLLLILLLGVVIYVILTWEYQGRPMFIYDLYKNGPEICTYLIFMIIGIIWELVSLTGIYSMWKREKTEGQEKDKSEKRWLLSMVRISKGGNQLFSIGITCLSLLLIFTGKNASSAPEGWEISAVEREAYPVPTLSELEGTEIVTGYDNNYSMETGMLINVGASFYTKAKVADLSYWAIYVETSSEFMIDRFMKEYMYIIEKESDSGLENVDTESVDIEGADCCYYKKGKIDSNFSIILRKGKQIVYMNYKGDLDYRQVADGIIKQLQ